MARSSESIRAVITELESLRASLQKEQDDSQDIYDGWKEDGEEGDEPEVVSNEEEIDRLDRAINFLEKAVDELDD